jgi:hypothetical protein
MSFEEILSRAQRNFEEHSDVWELSIIMVIWCIFRTNAYYNYVINIWYNYYISNKVLFGDAIRRLPNFLSNVTYSPSHRQTGVPMITASQHFAPLPIQI